MGKRTRALVGLFCALSTVGACQLVTGLDGLSTQPEASGAGGGATSLSASSGADASVAGSGASGSGGAGGDPGAGGGGGVASGTGGAGGGGGGVVVNCTVKCPEPLVVGTAKAPVVLALNSTHLFWHNPGMNDPYEGSIWRAALDGTGEVLVVEQATPDSIVADAQNVYYTDNTMNGAVMFAPAYAPSNMGTQLQVDVGVSANAITADAQNLYWVLGSGGLIKMRSKIAGPQGTTIASDMPLKITGLVYSNPYILWKGSQGISRIQVEPVGMPVLVTSAAASPVVYEISADENGSYVYWTMTAAPGSVNRALLRGASEPGEVLVSGEDRPYRVAATASHVVWSANGPNCSAGTGSVRRRALGAGPQDVEILADGTFCVTNFVQNGTHIFFASGNTIYRIPK